MKIAVYPGSFDPITNGHLDVIRRARKIFDLVYIAVITNPEKDPLFSISKRIEMIQQALTLKKGLKVESFKGLLVDYARARGATSIIRGLRAVSDFDYEFQMAITNYKMCPQIETLFLMTDYKYSYLSSNFVKQIARLGGSISQFVPPNVEKKLKNLFAKRI